MLLESLEAELGITRADLENVTFVIDNGPNLVKALDDFRRHYCVCHGLNIAVRTGMTIKYHSLMRNCLDSSPRAAQVRKKNHRLFICCHLADSWFPVNL